ncbi:MAG: YncE family protein [Candidatus Symbiothrix sp.]|jgi:hypothetical protein|nr:YncE family protein [Candidatus Symbiothrix sp.]
MKKKSNLLSGFLYFLMIAFATVFTACEEEDPIEVEKPVPGAHGVFILNEGSYSKSNSGLTYRNLETGQTFADILTGQLGDTGQDMISYGSKLYITVHGSKYIKVIDLHSHAPLASIRLEENGEALAPRFLASYEGKVYATTYDPARGNVVRIDTADLQVEAMVKVGAYPEGIAALNGKLYVANGGWGAGNTLSVIDIGRFEEEKTIRTGSNPYIVRAAPNTDNIYVSCQGDFGDNPGGLLQIDTRTGDVTDVSVPANRNFTIVDGRLYYFGILPRDAGTTSGAYNITTKEITPVITDGTKISIMYGIGVNPLTKDVYISETDYVNPTPVYVFGPDGKKKETIQAGIGPNSFVFY